MRQVETVKTSNKGTNLLILNTNGYNSSSKEELSDLAPTYTDLNTVEEEDPDTDTDTGTGTDTDKDEDAD